MRLHLTALAAGALASINRSDREDIITGTNLTNVALHGPTPIDICEGARRSPPWWRGGRVGWSAPECLARFLRTVAALVEDDPEKADNEGPTNATSTRRTLPRPNYRWANLAPAGTGTATLSQTLRGARVPHAHHKHHYTIELLRLRRELLGDGSTRARDAQPPDSFAITLREPAARLESGYRHRALELARRPKRPRAKPIDTIIGQWRHAAIARTTDDPDGNFFAGVVQLGADVNDAERARAPPPQIMQQFYWPQAGYLHAAAFFGATRLGLLCTETLSADLSALVSREEFLSLGGGGRRPVEVTRAHARAGRAPASARGDVVGEAHARRRRRERGRRALSQEIGQLPAAAVTDARERSHLTSAALRRWLNFGAYPVDTALYLLACRGTRSLRNTTRIDEVAATVLRERARLARVAASEAGS